METPEKQLQASSKNSEDDNVATTSSPKAMDSPKTPVQKFDSSFDEDTDEMESPNFPHLIPVYHRRTPDEYDLDGVRIGWDDGFGSVCFQDDDYIIEKNGKKRIRRRNRLFSERHRSFFGAHNDSPQNTNSPSPSSSHAAIQAELNDYLGCILSCLSAKKRQRQLMKSKSEENSTKNVVENNNISHLLDDSADDEMMLLCSQAIEKTIAADTNCNNTNNTASKHTLSIPGISPLDDTNDAVNNNVYHHTAKKFKPIQFSLYPDDKKNVNVPSQCHTITSKSVDKSQNNTGDTTSDSNKKDSSSFLNDSFANDDEWFSTIDLSAIEQDLLLDNKTVSVSATQKSDKVCNKQLQNININKQLENKSTICTSTIPSHSSSVLWRRCTSSSSIANPHLQPQTSLSRINEATTNSKISGDTKIQPTKRYCTPAEIEAKRERARRTLMLKFKSKNKSAT